MPKQVETPEISDNAAKLLDSLNKLALNIQTISAGFEALQKSKVNRHFLLTLLKPMTGLTFVDINRVLDALPKLGKEYTK